VAAAWAAPTASSAASSVDGMIGFMTRQGLGSDFDFVEEKSHGLVAPSSRYAFSRQIFPFHRTLTAISKGGARKF
jgi:hypothetical protein